MAGPATSSKSKDLTVKQKEAVKDAVRAGAAKLRDKAKELAQRQKDLLWGCGANFLVGYNRSKGNLSKVPNLPLIGQVGAVGIGVKLVSGSEYVKSKTGETTGDHLISTGAYLAGEEIGKKGFKAVLQQLNGEPVDQIAPEDFAPAAGVAGAMGESSAVDFDETF